MLEAAQNSNLVASASLLAVSLFSASPLAPTRVQPLSLQDDEMDFLRGIANAVTAPVNDSY
jgi:hypothetical protein